MDFSNLWIIYDSESEDFTEDLLFPKEEKGKRRTNSL